MMLKKINSFEEMKEMIGKPVFGYRDENERWFLVYGCNPDKMKESYITLLDSDGFLHDIREDHFQYWRLKYLTEAQN